MSEAENLDPAAVERLKRLGGSEFAVKMIDLFSSYATEKLAVAQQAQAAGNLTGVADAVHPIKSSAGNVGARKVQELARQIEELARQSQGEPVSALLAELERVFMASQGELEQVKHSLVGQRGEAN